MDAKKFVFAKPRSDPDDRVFARPTDAAADSLDVVGQMFKRDSARDRQTYAAFSNPPDPLAPNKPDPTIYRGWDGPVREGFFHWTTSVGSRSGKDYNFKISYTRMGDRGIPMLFLHGVPTNKRQWYPVQRLCAPFFNTVSIDMLGMGKSSMPLDYGGPDSVYWQWRYDVPYIEALMQDLFGDQKFIFVGDDWGTFFPLCLSSCANRETIRWRHSCQVRRETPG